MPVRLLPAPLPTFAPEQQLSQEAGADLEIERYGEHKGENDRDSGNPSKQRGGQSHGRDRDETSDDDQLSSSGPHQRPVANPDSLSTRLCLHLPDLSRTSDAVVSVFWEPETLSIPIDCGAP